MIIIVVVVGCASAILSHKPTVPIGLLLDTFPIQNTKGPKACANPIMVTRIFSHWPMGSLGYISNQQFMLVSY